MKPHALLLALALAMTAPTHAADTPTPPDVAKKPHVVRAPFGAERQDEYYWLRDDTRKNPAMLAYLQAENAYADALLAPTRPVQDAMYGEIVARIKQDDASVPFRERGWWYYSRFEAGKDVRYYENIEGGHGGAANNAQQAHMNALAYTFLWQQLAK